MSLRTEQDLLSELELVCAANGIVVQIDPAEFVLQSPCAIDVEHDESGELVGIGVYDGNLSLYFTNQARLDVLSGVLQKINLVAHNGKGDFDSLRQWGIPVLDTQLTHDTNLIAHIQDSSRGVYGLKALAKADLGIEYPSYEDIVGKRAAKERRTLDKLPVRLVALYNALDCFVTYKLYQRQLSKPSFPAVVDYFNKVEKPASYVFQAMETRGIRVDLNYLEGLKNSLEAQKAPLQTEIENELGPINLNSPKQLIGALHAKQIFPELKAKPSTDKRALERHKGVPVVDRLLQFSEIETLLTSFVYPYLERNQEVVKPFFNQCGTRTGRPSCSNPNLLQIPRRTTNGKLVRRMFIPRDGFTMGDCDFGQIEPRVLAHLSKDPSLCDMFNQGIDFHTFTSGRLSISRDMAKILNLSVGYRATFKSVSAQLKCSKEEAEAQIKAWWAMFPALRRWQEKIIYESKRSGYCTTLLGRRIPVDGLDSNNSWKREAAERQLINNITQGSAAEIAKMAMVRIHNDPRMSQSFGLLVYVYDELLFESAQMPHDGPLVVESMTQALKLDVPLTVDFKTGSNWSDAH